MAIVALARKVLALIYHLLINRERYLDEAGTVKTVNLPKIRPNREMDVLAHHKLIHFSSKGSP